MDSYFLYARPEPYAWKLSRLILKGRKGEGEKLRNGERSEKAWSILGQGLIVCGYLVIIPGSIQSPLLLSSNRGSDAKDARSRIVFWTSVELAIRVQAVLSRRLRISLRMLRLCNYIPCLALPNKFHVIVSDDFRHRLCN